MTPSSSFPIQKVSLPVLAGMVLAVLFWAIRTFTTVVIDAEGAVLITALVSGVVGYMTPIAPGEIKIKDLPLEPHVSIVQVDEEP